MVFSLSQFLVNEKEKNKRKKFSKKTYPALGFLFSNRD